jgi:hypothetical protein
MILRGQRLDEGGQPEEKRSVLSGTNMTQALSPKGKLMAARDNPTTSTRQMKSGPPPQDGDLPPGAGEISLGTSQPRGDAGSQELPLRHKNAYPRRRSP